MNNEKRAFSRSSSRKCPLQLTAHLIKIIIEEIRKACKKEPLSFGFNPEDNAYEPLKLMQAVMSKTNEVCLRYLDNSMLCSLPVPENYCCVTSVCAVKNTRRRMEDRHAVVHDLNTIFNIQEKNTSSYYAIFDGHAGLDAAAYSSAHLHQFLVENKYFVSNPKQALVDAFCKTDALFIDKCKVENLSSGTTAAVALLRLKEKALYVAWAGDSQVLLVNQGRLLQCVNPHKPERKDEKERIEKSGGCVIMWGTWRVNGQLAVSRAIGDLEYKPYVTAVPDVREISLDGGEDFLILACDGLWDVVSEDSVAREVYYMLAENPDDTDRISEQLVKLARQQGSTDNISVIVVFLREPSKIAAEAHRWAYRNGSPPYKMDTSLDNANNPFSNSNGAGTDSVLSHKAEELLLNITDSFTHNGSNLSPSADIFEKEKSNGKKSFSEFNEEDDFGPETDVDAVDDALLKSPLDTNKSLEDPFGNNNPTIIQPFNPFIEHKEKASSETDDHLQKQTSNEFEDYVRREEIPTPPADAVHDVALLDNAAESDSEDEWNYFKGEEANKENIPQPSKEVGVMSTARETNKVAEPLDDDSMSQLNPNAAEFVPVSPTRSIPSPACRALLNDDVISRSPKRPVAVDINVPNESEFEKEVKSRPSDIDSYSNGHNETGHNTSNEMMENLLNGKSIDDIPEFQPGSTPSKLPTSEEFHFGPNAAPFTPAKLLDQSEAALSTKAVYGDESAATIGTSFNESEFVTSDLDSLNKASDPMSASFYAEKGGANPFDLTKVHALPEDIDEFLKKDDEKVVDLNKVHVLPKDIDEFLKKDDEKVVDNTILGVLDQENLMDDTISDLPEHDPLGRDKVANNDDAIKTTDLDKDLLYEEKELASPLEPQKELENVHVSQAPHPQDDLLADFVVCERLESTPPGRDIHQEKTDSHSPTEFLSKPSLSGEHPSDSHWPTELLRKSPIPQEQLSEPHSTIRSLSKSPHPPEQLYSPIESPIPQEHILSDSHLPTESLSKSPLPEEHLALSELQTGACDLRETISPPVDTVPESKSPLLDLQEQEIQMCDKVSLELLKSTPLENSLLQLDLHQEFNIPICELPDAKSPNSEVAEVNSPLCKLPTSESAVCDETVKSTYTDIQEVSGTSSPVCDISGSRSPVCDIAEDSDLPAEKSVEKEVVNLQHVEEKEFEQSSLHEDVTSSVKDASSPLQDVDVNIEIGTSLIKDQATLLEANSDQFSEFNQGSVLPDILNSSTNERESVATTDVYAAIEKLQLPELTSPLSPSAPEEVIRERPAPDILDLQQEFSKSAEIDIKTENVAPQYPEQTVITPSEDQSRQEKISASEVPSVEEFVQEVEGLVVNKIDIPVAETVLAAEKDLMEPKKDIKKVAGTVTKKPIGKVQPTTKQLTKTLVPPKSATGATKTNTSPKTALSKTTTRPPVAATKSTPITKASPKPAPRTTTSTTSKTSTEKKTLLNGDVKSPIKSATATAKTTKPASATHLKTNITRTTAPRPTTVPKASVPQRPLPSARPATLAPVPKTRPTTLASKTTVSTLTAAKPSAMKIGLATPKPASPKTATAPKPKPPISSPAKPRVPLTRTVAKAPDTEKQNKESANKLTASRTTTTSKSSVTNTSARVNSLRRNEPKTMSATRTTSSRTTTTTTKSTTSKKPEEITRIIKTKTTKIEKPKENGVSTVVTEEITVVNNLVNDNVDHLLKDNSPVDNKLILENTFTQVNPAD